MLLPFFFFDFSKPKLYLTEPLSCFFFFPTHIYIHVVIHHALYPFRQVFFPLFSLFFFLFLSRVLVSSSHCLLQATFEFVPGLPQGGSANCLFFFSFEKEALLLARGAVKAHFFVVVYVCSLLRLSLSQPPCALFSCSLYIQVYDIREHQPSGTFFFFACYIVFSVIW